MFEPITISLIGQSLITSQVIGSIVGGIIGNRADSLLCSSIQTIYQRFVHQPNNLVNHDIQRAVRESYLKAALMVCESFRNEKYNLIDHLFHFPTWDLKELVNYLRRELKQVRKAKFILPANPIDGEHIVLLQPKNIAAKKRLDEIQLSLKMELFRELEQANLCIEDELKRRIQDGWLEDGQVLDWFDLMMAYFAEIQKTNERVRTAVQQELLLDIQKQVQGLGDISLKFTETVAGFQTALESLLPRVDKFLAYLEQIGEKLDNVEDDTSYIRKRIDELDSRPKRNKYLNTFADYNLDNLIGRQRLLKDIHNHFGQRNTLLLRGVGGIGKTTLGKAYIKQFADAYEHLAYVEIPDTMSLPVALMLRLATNDTGFVEKPDLTPEKNFNQLLECLRHIPNALLVLDNCNNYNELIKYRPLLESLRWKVLVTSRCHIDSFQREGISWDVKHLPKSDALRLFTRHYRTLTVNEKDTVEELLKTTYYHTKLIVLLAKAAYKNPLFKLEQMAEAVARGTYEHQRLNLNVELEAEEGRVFDFIMLLFKPEALNEQEQQYLRYFSILPAEDIPVEHLQKLFNIDEVQEVNWLYTIDGLTRLGWLESISNQSYRIHPLVQLVIRKKLTPTVDNCFVLIDRLGWMLKTNLYDNPLDKRFYFPYVQSIESYFNEQASYDLVIIYNNAADKHRLMGQYEQALIYDRKAIAFREQVLPEDHPDLAISYNNVAVSYRMLGQYQQALIYDQKAITIRKKVLAGDNPLLATSYSNAAITYKLLGQFHEALIYDQKAIAIFEKVLTESHPDMATCYSNVAATYLELKQPHESLKYQLKDISIREKALAKDHPSLAISYNNVAAIYQQLGQYEQALVYDQKAIAIREKVLPEDHPDLAISFNNISETYRQLGQYNQALIYDEKAIAIREKVLRKDHPEIADSYHNVAMTYYYLYKYRLAQKFMKQAITIWGKSLPNNHPYLLQALDSLIVIEERLGELR